MTSIAAAGAARGLFAYTKPSDSPDAIAIDLSCNERRIERLLGYKHNIAVHYAPCGILWCPNTLKSVVLWYPIGLGMSTGGVA